MKMHAPLLPLAVAMMAGIAMSPWVNDWLLPLCLLALVVIATFFAGRYPRLQTAGIWVAALLLGMALGSRQRQQLNVEWPEEKQQMELVVVSEVKVKEKTVVFDALTAAKARQADVVICDTAGRLHNKKNLMKELEKISRIVHQQAEGCALEVLLALDATTGQNAVNQAQQFNEAADITGIILTKLDGTAKGGIIITITDDLKIPVKLVTVGEQIDDIQPFIARDFVEALFE